MEKIYQYLDRTADNLCQYAPLVENPGLMNGKMGIALFLYRCGRMIDQPVCERIAEELVDDVLERLSMEDPIDFETGLCGIGYGIDYLIKNKYVEAESEEILENLDAHIASVTEQSKTGNKKLISTAKYLLKRGNHELFDRNITRLIESLTQIVENVKTQEDKIIRFIVRCIGELLLFHVVSNRAPGNKVTNLYNFVLKSDWGDDDLQMKWSDKYVCKEIHNLFRDGMCLMDINKPIPPPIQGNEIKLTDLLTLKNLNIQYGFNIPMETHLKIKQILTDDNLLDEWIDLALPTTMHINGYMTGFGWILLDMLDARSQAQSLKP